MIWAELLAGAAKGYYYDPSPLLEARANDKSMIPDPALASFILGDSGMPKGQLIALSDNRWKYVTGGKVVYIRHWPDRHWSADRGDGLETLEGCSCVETAVSAVDHRPTLASNLFASACPSCRLHGIHTYDAATRVATCKACGRNRYADLCACGGHKISGSPCPTCGAP